MIRTLLTLVAFSVISTACCCSVPATEIDAYTEPYREIEIAASEMGTLSSVVVIEGQQVDQGEVLASLDEQVLKVSLRMTKKAMESTGRLNSAEAELKLQQERYAKLAGLRDRRHASQIEVDRAEMQVSIAAARVQTVQEELAIKQMEYERIKAQLELRRVRSPISGIVTRVSKDNGEFVSANDPVVATVVQLDPLRVVFSVPVDQAGGISAGDSVTVKVGVDNRPAVGRVEFVSPTADAQSGTRRVKVRIPNPGHQLQSGAICRMKTDDLRPAAATASTGTSATVGQVSARPSL